MKVHINEVGVLTVESETAVEAFALRQWLKENPVNTLDEAIPARNLIFVTRVTKQDDQ
ncbi:hypothetical protein [Cupriavidus metallidurans]|uniref:hypothetical protein n=1 Tax=Cupriavidus metallidurans TaxID=119219 RepID=UPI001CCB8472|nr:hypothetical protein [Cupriavidus metallidurans]UBM12690.1 hypothetical protein LAI70_28160 [Cupriavidus metallidurans]